MTATPQTIIAQALRVPADAIRVEPRTRLTHQSNNLYDAWAGERHMVVKEYLKPDEMEEAPMREAGAMRLLAPLDIAPQLVLCHAQVEPDFGPFVVYDWMEGEMWDRRRPAPHELGRLAELWLTLHEIPTDGLWRSEGRSMQQADQEFTKRFRLYAEWVRAEYPAAQPSVELGWQLFERRHEVGPELEQLAPVFRFCRGDARFANVIGRSDGRLGMIDWEDCGLRDPARDIADLLTAANQEDLLTWVEWQAFLRPYLDGRAASDPDLEHRAELYLAVFPIFWFVILISHGLKHARNGQLARWTINDMAPNQRLRRYLARALAWPKTEFTGELDALAGLTFFPEE